MLKPGLYEQVINKDITEKIDESSQLIDKRAIDDAEAAHIISNYLAEIIEKGLARLGNDNIDTKLLLANKIVSAVTETTGDDEFDSMSIDNSAQQLLAIADIANNADSVNKIIRMPRPETPMSSSSLFTGAVHEPQLISELKKEILSADRIDMLVSFIKWSGIRLIYDELEGFTGKGGKLRIITTSYMGATDAKAVEELRKLPNTEIKVYYDTKCTRLHAKSYMFYRNTGFTTAYVGSSNLSKAAVTDGREWNLKITAHDQPHTIRKINATFESYWNGCDCVTYSESEREHLIKALHDEKFHNETGDYSFDIRPFPYQQEILDKLSAERNIRGHYKNLVVAATGTGKTVISAFDYKRFKASQTGHARLLFVAHRKEILNQSLKCFRGVLHDANFGELFYGGIVPSSFDALFISIDTFNSQKLDEKTTPDFYDYIIVDEFHHAAAPTYQKLMEYYEPKILLGLTATPERMDGKNILKYFDNRIAAEIRLPEAIDRQLLCPFHYFGISDEIDLKNVKWSRGGYDRTELSNIYTGNDIRVMMIIRQMKKYATDIDTIKGLGFCVSKEHAEYMAKRFNESSIPSISLTADSSKQDRESAQSMLINGDIRFIFTVDLYNEGVDIPSVNTVMFLRPTESLTVFLQQLGRGLRLSEGKECLTVLDFIGQANRKYNFESKFSALLDTPDTNVKDEIEKGFPLLPRGCYIKLEKQAQNYILDNIKQSLGNKSAIIRRIQAFAEDSGMDLTLGNFLNYYNIDVSSVYATKTSFARLCVQAGVKENFDERLEDVITKALPRLSYMDSHRWIEFVIDYLPKINTLSINDFNCTQLRMLQMLQFTIWQKSWEECGFSGLLDGFGRLAESPVLLSEILDLLYYKYDRIDFVDEPLEIGYDCPLDVHCTYTRDQILVALDFMKPNTLREGAKYLENKKTDLLFITLNKSDKDYSPTTMYNDYSQTDTLFHWQSQSTITPQSRTGQRYINHRKENSNIMLFVREYKNSKLGAMPYTFLGLADFVSYEGSKPMNIIWKLRKPIPAKYIRKTNQVGAV
ncbi:MAG: DUF3427 domain-containing protein [Ruminiclostridium sp.]